MKTTQFHQAVNVITYFILLEVLLGSVQLHPFQCDGFVCDGCLECNLVFFHCFFIFKCVAIATCELYTGNPIKYVLLIGIHM